MGENPRWVPKLLRGIYRTSLTWKDQNLGVVRLRSFTRTSPAVPVKSLVSFGDMTIFENNKQTSFDPLVQIMPGVRVAFLELDTADWSEIGIKSRKRLPLFSTWSDYLAICVASSMALI